MQEISLFHWLLLEIQPIFEFCNQSGHIHFLTTPIPIFFNQILIFMNLYQPVKNRAISLFCYRDVFDLKILKLIDQEHLRNQTFPKYGIFAGI